MAGHVRSFRSACALALALAGPAGVAVRPATAAQPHPLVAEQRAACTGDVFRLCGTEAPRVDQIIACLKKARPSLSPACRSVVDQKG
ncbi:hypothetical protein [Rhodoplanes roseus]|uniref:Cysteine rich repeat-containing protein n=1 Tax=Rhodoplanes roseus TaxID=29409 RepID=A0A327KU59_9BRAD|nr:hypothetical protein [Rhodoplanes roseus]RAI41566.1 hypothetical protein CH341_21420 [Rhodoplanes roseus]